MERNYPIDHVEVLLGAAEVGGQVGHAQGLVLAYVHPALILTGARDAVEEDPEGLPHRLLAH